MDEKIRLYICTISIPLSQFWNLSASAPVKWLGRGNETPSGPTAHRRISFIARCKGDVRACVVGLVNCSISSMSGVHFWVKPAYQLLSYTLSLMELYTFAENLHILASTLSHSLEFALNSFILFNVYIGVESTKFIRFFLQRLEILWSFKANSLAEATSGWDGCSAKQPSPDWFGNFMGRNRCLLHQS